MALSRLTGAGVLLLLSLALLAGCTDLRPGEGSTGIATQSPVARIADTPRMETPPATGAPTKQPPAGEAAPPATPAPPEPESPGPVPEPTPVAKTFRTEPLVQVTGDPWESYATWQNYPFEYRSLGHQIWVPYNTAAYEQVKIGLPARNDERVKEFAQLYTLSNDWWYLALPLPGQEAYYRALIADPANDLPYESILTPLREIRDRYQLDDNEYAELVARFVQRAVPGREWEEGRVVERYPLETIGDLGGNRVDKSLLLAGLLAREGYGVALIYFPDVNLLYPDVNRMIVGIRGEGAAGYGGYLGIDPSTETFFGVYAPQAAPIIPDLQYYVDYKVITVSEGKRYTAGPELRLIWDRLTLMYFYDRVRDYTKDLRFVWLNRDDRQMVFEYLAYLGPWA